MEYLKGMRGWREEKRERGRMNKGRERRFIAGRRMGLRLVCTKGGTMGRHGNYSGEWSLRKFASNIGNMEVR